MGAIDNFAVETAIDQTVERIIFSTPVYYWLWALGPLGLSFAIFISFPSPASAVLLAIATAISYVTQLCWIGASNRWLLKTILEVSVFEIRKYDLLFCVMLILGIASALTTVQFNLQLVTASPNFNLHEDYQAYFSFLNLIFFGVYILYLIITTVAAIKSENRILNIPNTHIGKFTSYMYLPVTVYFVRKRHEELRKRLHIIEEALAS